MSPAGTSVCSPRVAVQLGHERLAEAHHLTIRVASRIEVGATLTTADRHSGERVLEHLIEAQELHDREVDRGVEAQTALIGAEGAIELNPKPAVDLDRAAIIGPDHAEDDLSLGLADAFEQLRRGVGGVLGDDRPDAMQHTQHRLVKLGFPGVPPQHGRVQGLQLLIQRQGRTSGGSRETGGSVEDGRRRLLAGYGHGKAPNSHRVQLSIEAPADVRRHLACGHMTSMAAMPSDGNGELSPSTPPGVLARGRRSGSRG